MAYGVMQGSIRSDELAISPIFAVEHAPPLSVRMTCRGVERAAAGTVDRGIASIAPALVAAGRV